jgi:hypothetical protein
MDSKKLGEINQARADQALSATRHQEIVANTAKVSDSVLSATSSLIKYLEGKVTQTEVINQLESISTPDVKFVVEALQVLDQTIKDTPQTDLSGVTQLMQDLVDQAKLIPKDHPTPIKPDKPLDYTKQLKGLADAIKAVEKVVKAQKLIAEAPIVNVPAPNVKVDAPDLAPLQNGFRDVVKAVQKIIIPEYKTDNKAVEKLLKDSNKLLKSILEKPVGGGGGGGQSWTSVNPAGTPVPLNLTASGALITDATFSGSVTSSPTFKDDPTNAAEAAKYGKRNSSTLKPYMEADLNEVGGAAFALGQQLAASSLPIVLTAAQITSLTPPAAITGYATSANQDPLVKYKAANIDSGVTTASVNYYGFLQTTATWIVMKEDQTVTGKTTYTFANLSNNATMSGTWGSASATDPWTHISTLSYGYLSTLTGV